MDMDNVKYLLLLAFAISVTSRRVYDVDVEDVPKKVFEISVSRTAHDVDEMLKVVSKGSWDSFKREYAKKYKNKTEENLRKKIYFENKRKISKHNQLYELGQTSFKLGLNEYSDLQGEEFVAAMCGSRYINSTNNFSEAVTFNAPDFDVPESMDWRTKGAVTPVKYQGLCGSCWAFSATGSLEGQVFRTTNKLVSLSEQNLIDCSVTYGNYGCDGGFSINAFKFIMDNGGIDTEESYPYEAVDATCSYKSIDSGAIVRAFGMIVPGSENELKKAVATIGPISVLLDASLSSFQQYKEGVYYDYKCSSSQLNHAVLVVGYGSTKNGLDYWIVKNSWGTSWGDDGYFLMARNERNNCGMTTAASYPLV